MTKNYQAIVEAVKEALEKTGQTWKTNCDAFQITARVAWALRDVGAKLVLKSTGNLCRYNGVDYSVDGIAFPDGWVDCLVKAGPPANANAPAWQWHPAGLPAPGTFAEPFNLDAEAPPVVVDEPAVDLPPDIAALVDVVRQLREDLKRIEAQQARGYTLTLAPTPPKA